MIHPKTWAFTALLAAALCVGCEKEPQGTPAGGAGGQPATVPAATGDAAATANIKKAEAHTGEVTGTVKFYEQEDGVRVVADVKGLSPGLHGFHIHEKGDLSDPKLTSAGPHFNPGGHQHGGPEAEMRHAGDLGNLEADAQGNAKLDKVFKGFSIKGEKDGIVSRSIIIHAKADDLKTDPSGESGDRIAGGVIETGAGTGGAQ